MVSRYAETRVSGGFAANPRSNVATNSYMGRGPRKGIVNQLVNWLLHSAAFSQKIGRGPGMLRWGMGLQECRCRFR